MFSEVKKKYKKIAERAINEKSGKEIPNRT